GFSVTAAIKRLLPSIELFFTEPLCGKHEIRRVGNRSPTWAGRAVSERGSEFAINEFSCRETMAIKRPRATNGSVAGAATFAPGSRRHRIFLLSPANIAGQRAKLVLRAAASFPLAERLRTTGAPLGEVFSFISGLYFRGKLAYARAFADPPPRVPGVVVITAGGGLVSPDKIVTLEELMKISSAKVEVSDPEYRLPLEQDA